MHIVIVANAPELDLASHVSLIQSADAVLAADGGALALLRVGVLPALVIGDLDSLDGATVAALREQNVLIRSFPRAKDETDLELALLHAAQLGAAQIDVLGALGGRWDHTLANVGLLDHPVLLGRQVRLVAERQTLFLVRDVALLEGAVGDTVSLVPLRGDVQGVSTEGLLYPLADATLHFHQARGISNVLLEPPGRVSITHGLLLVVQHDDGGAHQWRTTDEEH